MSLVVIFAVLVGLFILVALSFPIYIALKKPFSSLHWTSKALYGLFVFIGWIADNTLGVIFSVTAFQELPKIEEFTLSYVCRKHQSDSKLAKHIWGEIRKIDPTHLD